LLIDNPLLKIKRLKRAIDFLPITGKIIASLKETSRLMPIDYSKQIEGNTLTILEMKQLVMVKSGFMGREHDEREVRNYFAALEYVEEQLIQSIHDIAYNKKNNKYCIKTYFPDFSL
jgi:Fic family protein